MLKIGIVGLPNVGKSTLFNALTGCRVPAENYPFCTIDPSVGIVPVPDERLQALGRLSHSEKIIPPVVEFFDIAGLVGGASEGEGLGNQFLSHIREVDAIVEVVRVFSDNNITHVHGDIDPLCDVHVLNLELMLADMQTIIKRKDGLLKELKWQSKEAVRENTVLEKLETTLGRGAFAGDCSLTEEERKIIKPLNLLTRKPIIYVLNTHYIDQPLPRDLTSFFEKERAPWLMLDIRTEGELQGLREEERDVMRSELGMSEAGLSSEASAKMGLDALIQKGYELLSLITFFTSGPQETRGWTIREGAKAPEAGAAIHSDFCDKFIRAEVAFWKDLVDAGSYASAREKGIIRTEGKGYVVKDGDVIVFKI